jgi:hypothetical protein
VAPQHYAEGRVTELGQSQFKIAGGPGPGVMDLYGGETLKTREGNGQGSASSISHLVQHPTHVNVRGAHDPRRMGSALGTGSSAVDMSQLEFEDPLGYQPQELDGDNGLNGYDDSSTDWGHDDTASQQHAPTPPACAMTVEEWSAHAAQMSADEAHSKRTRWWWLAGGAVAGYLAARMMR